MGAKEMKPWAIITALILTACSFATFLPAAVIDSPRMAAVGAVFAGFAVFAWFMAMVCDL